MITDTPDVLPLALLDQVATATTRLLDTARDLTDADVIAPSLLPGWTRGHVLAHLSRNADSLVNLLIWARTGIETPQYASPFLRDFDIDAGAPRPLAEQVIDLEASAARWSALATTAPPQSWRATVRTRAGREIPAAEVPWMRLLEVEIHHVDLNSTYTPADWPTPFLHRTLTQATTDLGRSLQSPFTIRATDTDFTTTVGPGTPTHTIEGPSPALLAWLIGRSPGTDLTGDLPDLPAWR